MLRDGVRARFVPLAVEVVRLPAYEERDGPVVHVFGVKSVRPPIPTVKRRPAGPCAHAYQLWLVVRLQADMITGIKQRLTDTLQWLANELKDGQTYNHPAPGPDELRATYVVNVVGGSQLNKVSRCSQAFTWCIRIWC